METGSGLHDYEPETACGSDLLHNMSAPPKSKMTVQPLRSSNSKVMATSIQSPSCSSGGLTWIMRIDLDRLIQPLFPEFEAWMADGQVNPGGFAPSVTDGSGRGGGESPAKVSGDHYLRLRSCLVIAQVMAGVAESVTIERVEALRVLPHETLCDQLRTLCAGIDPSPLGLPALGIMTTGDRADRPCETDPSRVFYALSRLSGSTFVRSGSAMIAGLVHGNIVRDLWVPA